MQAPATITLEEVFELCPICMGAGGVGDLTCEFCEGAGGRRLGWRKPCATCANTGAVRATVPTPLDPKADPIYTDSVCPDCLGWSKNIWMVVVARPSAQSPGLFSIDRVYVDEPSPPSS